MGGIALGFGKRAGADRTAVQRTATHSSPATTARYDRAAEVAAARNRARGFSRTV
jgi:hypothetical protein